MTGLCVDIPEFGKGKVDGPVAQFSCRRSGDNQLWDLVVNQKGAGPHGADLFTIRNSMDSYCLDLPDYGPANKAAVTEYHCRPGRGDNQMWYLEKKANNQFWIRNHISRGQCLNVSGAKGSGGNAARLTIAPCDIKDDHLWSLS
jgi:hypothetical protein